MRSLCTMVAALLLSGCAGNFQLSGPPAPMQDEQSMQYVNLVAELVPQGRSEKPELQRCIDLSRSSAQTNPLREGVTSVLTEADANACLSLAFKAFYADAIDQKLRRNRVQASLRRASDSQCDSYLQFVNKFQSRTNFSLGTLATTLAGAGAIVTNAVTARLLSGAAGIASGTRAEFDADIFYQQAVPLLLTAIRNKRSESRTEMDGKWQRSIDDYPVELAVADAVRYHGTCSLVAGLSYVQLAVNFANDPGLEGLNRALVKANSARLIQDRRISDTRLLNPDGSINGTAAAAMGISAGPISIAEPIQEVSRGISDTIATFTQAAAELRAIPAGQATDGKPEAAAKALDGYSDERVKQYKACMPDAVESAAQLMKAVRALQTVNTNDPKLLADAQKTADKAQSTADALARQLSRTRGLDLALIAALQTELRGNATAKDNSAILVKNDPTLTNTADKVFKLSPTDQACK